MAVPIASRLSPYRLPPPRTRNSPPGHRLLPGSPCGIPGVLRLVPVNATLGLSLSGSTLMVVGPPNSISQIGVEAQSLINPSHVDLAEGDSLTISPMQL